MLYRNTFRNRLIKNKKNERVQRAVLMMRATQFFNSATLHTITSLNKLKTIDNE